MIRSLRWYNQGRSRAGYSSVRIGIGIHSGNVMLGTIGEHYRMESSVVSDAVNLASRIQSVAAADQVLVSDVLKSLAFGSGLSFEDLGDFELKGFDGKWRLSEVNTADM